MTTDWSRLVRASLLGLEPYRPGASLEELRAAYGLDEIVKLNWNEGLHGPFPGVDEAVRDGRPLAGKPAGERVAEPVRSGRLGGDAVRLRERDDVGAGELDRGRLAE